MLDGESKVLRSILNLKSVGMNADPGDSAPQIRIPGTDGRLVLVLKI